MACPWIPKKPVISEKSYEGEEELLISTINPQNKTKNRSRFYSWKFATINIRSGKEKLEGAKMYMIAKEAARLNLSFCALQEVRHRGIGNKIIELNTGKKYQFFWCGQKKRRDYGVGILVKVDPRIIVTEPDFNTPRVMAINLTMFGFNHNRLLTYKCRGKHQ